MTNPNPNSESKRLYTTGTQRKEKLKEITTKLTDPQAKKALEFIAQEMFLKHHRTPIQDIVAFYDICHKISHVTLNSLSWTHLCDLSHGSISHGRITARLLSYMIDNDIYNGAYKNKLIDIRKCLNFDKPVCKNSAFYSKLFCGNLIKYMYRTPIKKFNGLIHLQCDNTFLSKLLYKFSQINKSSNNAAKLHAKQTFYKNFDFFLKEHTEHIKTYSDINCSVFEDMINNCRKYPGSETESLELLRQLRRFILFLCHEAQKEGITILNKTDSLSIRILQRNDWANLIYQNCKICYYNYLVPAPNSDIWLVNVTGYESTSTRLTAGQLIYCDFRSINSLFFRHLAKEYVWKSSKTVLINRLRDIPNLSKLLNQLSIIAKTETNLKNEEISRLKLWIINQQNIKTTTKNTLINIVLGFLRYYQQNNKITFEQYALDNLNVLKVGERKEVRTPPIEDVEKLIDIMKAKANQSTKNAYCYVILNLLIQTEFRISQICKLSADCIVPTIVSTAYNVKDKEEKSDKKTPKIIITASKTSNGQKYKSTINDYGKELIDEAKRLSKPFRDLESELSKYLFIYRDPQSNILQVINNDTFNRYLKACCEEAGIRNYTPTNFREFHMTKSEELQITKHYSLMKVNVLTAHASPYTTNKHYIETKILPYVATLAKTNIGHVDLDGYIKGDIADNIPSDIKNNAHQVEKSTGYCKRNICNEQSMISCLLCKSFITTVDKIPEFKRLLNYYDSLIKNAPYEHDKDDLINIKKLIACYLTALYTMISKKTDPNFAKG